jgi:hypothetical protein
MSDTDDDFSKALEEGLSQQEEALTPNPTVDPPKEDAPKEDPKPTDDKKEEPPKETPAEGTPPASPEDKKPEEGTKPPETPETPPETPQPLTKDDVTSIIRDLQTSERTSGKELETTTQEVLEAYYPEGLSNTLVDEKSGKELRTPADVVEASGGTMSTEEAAQWLMNEQFKLDQQVNQIKTQAKEIAETTVNFKRDSMLVLQKYEPLFKWQPSLQKKAFDLMMKQVKVDEKRGVILSAPDVMDLYDTYLEPYQQAYVFANNQSPTNPTPNPAPAQPKPTAEDRMDISGDGGPAPVDDPNDFAQQVTKELAKGA